MAFLNPLPIIAFAILIQCSLILAAEPTDLTRLRKDLKSDYSQSARPMNNNTNATILQMNPILRGIEFNEKRSIFTLHCWTMMIWTDERLRWEPKNYGNMTLIHFKSYEIWQPDLSVYNSLDMSDYYIIQTPLIVRNNGVVIWVPPIRFQVGCEEDLRKWPYDVQTCYVLFGSWAHDGTMLDLSLPVNVTTMSGDAVVENREWQILSTDLKKRTTNYGGIPYPDILLTVTMKRRSGTHTCAVVVPALAISTAILISFWLRPGSAERLALILLVIIINALYLNELYVQIMTHGDRVPLVLLFYRDSLIMASVTLVWTICLRYLAATKRSSPVPLPGFVGTFLASIPAKILCLDPRPVSGAASSDTDDDGKLVSSGNPHQADWAWLAHLLDRVAFVIYLIVYIIFYVAML